MSRRTTALLLAATLPVLGGCETGQKFAPACPSLALLRDAADLTRYGAGGRDVRDLVLDARITAVPADCTSDGPAKVRATLRVGFEVTRGLAATGRRASLAYFVAVTSGERVADEQDYGLGISFPPNLDRVSVTGEEIALVLPVTKEKSASAYQVYVGFRLTPEELAFNRQRGTR